MAADTLEQRKPGWRSVLLGLFVCFQLMFLILANLIQFVPREMPVQKGEFDIHVQRDGTATNVRSIQDAINALGTGIDRYGEASGQVQAWSLFAPEFGTQSIFLSVEYVCIDRGERVVVTIQSNNLPADPANYRRWPGPFSRRSSYDFLLAVVYLGYTEQSVAERGDQWRAAVRQWVRDQRRSLEAYFRFNLRVVGEKFPDLPKTSEMTLSIIVIPSPAPGQTERPASVTVPLARWLPDQPPEPGFLPIQAYDLVTKQFIRLPTEESER